MLVQTNTWRQRQEDCYKFKASLGYRVRFCQLIKKREEI